MHAVIDKFSRHILAFRVTDRFDISSTIAVDANTVPPVWPPSPTAIPTPRRPFRATNRESALPAPPVSLSNRLQFL